MTEPDTVQQVTERLGTAVELLDALTDQPVDEHVAHYDALHGVLQDALATIDRV
ncbi:MAG TPA: hypothetical protein VLJ59_07895 [Mycobacteriales bacterium]|nr:hypothetical protein [Mycobacteriales bacterium]